MTLQKYYSSAHWRKFRLSLTEDKDAKCEICQRPRWSTYKVNTKKHAKGDKKKLIRLSVHHKNYRCLNHETRDDVLTLCTTCHDLFHSLEKAAQMAPDVYKDVYEFAKGKTEWDYEKRPKDDKKLIE